MNAEAAIGVIVALREHVGPADQGIHLAGIPDYTLTEALDYTLHILELRLGSEARHEDLPENAGKTWDDAEDALLLMQDRAKMSVADMAVDHWRTEGAIQRRLEKLYASKGRLDANQQAEGPA